MLLGILLTLIVVVVALAAFVAMRPAEFRIERSATMMAAAATVFPYVNDVHKFQEWSPWAKRDPNMSLNFGGPPAGEGATVGWSGNKEVGEGSMTVTDSRADELVRYRLEFLKPFKAINTTEFSLSSEDAHSAVSWSMSGRNNFIAKAVGLFMNMDAMVGKDFEQGLASLKRLVED